MLDCCRLHLHEKHSALTIIMNANVCITPSELGLSASLSLADATSLETPYLVAIDTLRMVADVVSPSAKLNIIGAVIVFISFCEDKR